MSDTGTGRPDVPHLGFAVQHPYPAARAVRVEKMARTAAAAGYEVTVLSPDDARDPVAAPDPGIGGVLRLGRGWRRHLFRPNPLSVPWYLAGVRHLLGRRIDLLVVSDLKLALPMLLAARSCRVPVLLDLGENFTAATRIWARHDSAWKRWLRSGPHIAWLERACIRLADRVQVVVEERRQQLVAAGWGTPERLDVLENVPEEPVPEALLAAALRARLARPLDAPATLVYVGVITEDRGIDVAVRGVAAINHRAGRRRCRLLVVGDGSFGERLRTIAADAGGDCELLGWRPRDRADAIALGADIGIIPHWVNDFTNTTIPNKLFDYMNCALPVIASSMDPVERIVRETGCGVVYDGSQAGFERVVESLLDDGNGRELGRLGRKWVEQRFHWGAASETFLCTVRDLVGDPASADGARK